MSVTTRLAAAVAAAVLTALVVASAATAHAEFVSSVPAPDSEVSGPFDGPVELTFDEPLASGSHAELLDPAGATVAEAAIPADAPDELVFALDAPLGAGTYEVQWTTVAEDGDVERGTVGFTVLAPEPSATPEPSVTPAPSATPAETTAPSPTAAPSPTPSADGTPTSTSSDVLLPILAAVILLAVLAGVLLRNRRNRTV